MKIRPKEPIVKQVMIFSLFVVIFDSLIIITNLYVSPPFDGQPLSEILVYPMTAIHFFVFLVLLIWIKMRKPFLLTTSMLKSMLFIEFSISIFYFCCLFIQKYTLLMSNQDLLLNGIITGNKDLILNNGNILYNNLKYILTIFAGFNSEISLLFVIMVTQFFLTRASKIQAEEEEQISYDSFMFDKKLLPFSIIMTVLTFTSLNTFSWLTDIVWGIGNAIGLLLLFTTLPGIKIAYDLNKNSNFPCQQSFFTGSHKILKTIALVSLILSSLLIAVNVISFIQNNGSYRIFPATLLLAISIIYFSKIKKIQDMDVWA